MSNSTAPNRVPLSTLWFAGGDDLAGGSADKERKLSETENAVCNEKEFKNSFCKLGDDQKKEHDSEPKVDLAANRKTNLAIPISMEAAQIGTIPLVSQILERTTKSEHFPVSQAERTTHDIDFKGSIATMRDLQVRKKIIKTYVRKKHRQAFFKVEMLDHDGLHLLAETALNFGSGMQRQRNTTS